MGTCAARFFSSSYSACNINFVRLGASLKLIFFLTPSVPSLRPNYPASCTPFLVRHTCSLVRQESVIAGIQKWGPGFSNRVSVFPNAVPAFLARFPGRNSTF